jgi:hypothetical protein
VDPRLAFEPGEIGRDGNAKRCAGVVARNDELGGIHPSTAALAEPEVKATRRRRFSLLAEPQSSPPWRAPFPPVNRGWATNQPRGELGVGKVAELPQLPGGTAVLKDDLVDLEGIEFTGAKAVDGIANPLDKLR